MATLKPLAVVLVCTSLLVATPAVAQEQRLAVLQLTASGVEQSLAYNLSEVLTDVASRSGQYTVLSMSDVAQLLNFEGEKQKAGCISDTSCLTEMGGALGVEKLLTGSVGQIGDTYQITLKLMDIETATVAGRQTQTVGGQAENLIEAVKLMAAILLGGQAPATQTPAPPPASAAATSAPAASPSAAADGFKSTGASADGFKSTGASADGFKSTSASADGFKSTAPRPPPPAAPAQRAPLAKGTLAVAVSVAGAAIRLNNTPVGWAPLPGPVELEPGKYEVVVEAQGYKPHLEEVILSPGGGRDLVVVLEAMAPVAEPGSVVGLSTWGFVALGLGAAVGLGGGVTGYLAQQSHEEYQSAAEKDEARDLRSESQSRALAANVLYGTAGAVATAGLIMVLVDYLGTDAPPAAAPPPAVSVTPVSGGAVVGATGRW